MVRGPTLAVVSEATNSRATVGNSLGTHPREHEIPGQPSHAGFLAEPLRDAWLQDYVYFGSGMSPLEKSDSTARAVVRLTNVFSIVYETTHFGSSIANTVTSVAAAVHRST
jgi:hypothetical protein